jgi:16S rRNA (uracil1498-N3)-methyltransferase
MSSHQRRITLGDVLVHRGDVIALSRDQIKHLCTVLRLVAGDRITATAQGRTFSAVLTTLSTSSDRAQSTHITIEEETTSVQYRPTIGTLVFALGRNPVNDLVCEKACELGVEHLIFWKAKRSIIDISAQEVPQKLTRWSKISSSATNQSQRNTEMRVSCALDITELGALPPQLYLCSLSQDAQPITTITTIQSESTLIVGPAGDFTEEEERFFREHGAIPISLGHAILRSETAAIAGLAMAYARGQQSSR